MDKEDYRKFSYLIAFRNKYQTLAKIVLLAAIGAGIWVFTDEIFSVPKFFAIWAVLIATAFAAIFLRTEYKAFNRMNQARAGIISVSQTIAFYENYLVAEEDNVKGSNKIKYDRLYQVLELENYYIIYAGANSASMIRKEDIDEEDKTSFQIFLRAKLGQRYKNMIKEQKA